MYAHYDPNKGTLVMYNDYNHAMTNRYPHDEVDSDSYNKLIPALESNGRICPVCRRSRIEHYKDRCRTLVDYVPAPLPTGHPVIRSLVDTIVCSCGIYISRLKVNGKTRCFRASEDLPRRTTLRVDPLWTTENPFLRRESRRNVVEPAPQPPEPPPPNRFVDFTAQETIINERIRTLTNFTNQFINTPTPWIHEPRPTEAAQPPVTNDPPFQFVRLDEFPIEEEED